MRLEKVFERFDPFRHIYRFIYGDTELVCLPDAPRVVCRVRRGGRRLRRELVLTLFDLMRMLPKRIDRVEVVVLGRNGAKHTVAVLRDVKNPLR